MMLLCKVPALLLIIIITIIIFVNCVMGRWEGFWFAGVGRRRGWNRHSLHLFTYSFVSASLILMGLFFSAFAVFDKNSLIGQIWLAGPTTIAVGLVLCGKVMIDCRPIPGPLEEDESLADPELALLPPLPLAEIALSPKEQAVVNSIDAEYAKKKAAGQIVSIRLRQQQTGLSDKVETESVSTVSEIWSRRVLDASELMAAEAALRESSETPMPTPSPPMNMLSSTRSSPSTTPSLSPRPHHYHHRSQHHHQAHQQHQQRLPGHPSLPPHQHLPRSPSTMYQGETFVLHEMQFLI